jgi:spoIIIJ-associated protein
MSISQKREIEARGSDVEAAISSGLSILRVGRDEVEIEVLDRGSKGLLGIGARDAVVRLQLKAAPEPLTPPPPPPPQPKPEPVRETAVVPPPAPPKPKAQPAPQPVPQPAAAASDEDEELNAAELLVREQETAVAVLTELLAQMRVTATISATLSEPDDLTGEQITIIQISGQDMSSLIGPRGETLSSLQYISRLMVSHQLKQRANFVLDVEGYRQRREQALARLAERMAQKVVKQGRAMSLEPMPPHERRVIHMTLRNDKDVYTESTGEGNRRKVRIIPKD